MSEWWDYAPQDFLLFSAETYYRLFELHNLSVWPAHLYVVPLILTILLLAPGCGERGGRIIGGILALVWVWIGWTFHYERYATINIAATWFAAAFVLQGLLFVFSGVLGGSLRPCPDGSLSRLVCYCIFLFAIFVQPLLGLLLGRDLVGSELFGIAPDPTAVATLGLLGSARRVPWLVVPIPLLWCAISGLTLWTMASPDWFVTPGLALLALAAAIASSFRPATQPSEI